MSKKIDDQKLHAFTVGAMCKRPLTRKELEEQKKREEEEAAAHAFKEFVETFQNAPAPSAKIWVKAGTYDAGSRKEDNREKGKLYKPSSRLTEDKSVIESAQDYAKLLSSDNDSKKDHMSVKKKNQEKKKSNLELFKEELRQIQEEREERHKYKHIARQSIQHEPVEPAKETPAPSGDSKSSNNNETGSFDNGDPNTTNLYLGNLNPKISEQELMELFGRYGPLASIKIMWPRSEEEKSRCRNCGFVAYMSRRDAERALRALQGRDIMGYEMRLGWGKSVPILNQPIYIPQTLLELTSAPPPSGLPFNAQPSPSEAGQLPEGKYKDYIHDEVKKAKMEAVLKNSVVRVVVPTEKTLLCTIHRMIEFVIREGPMFEALVMGRELENPMYAFLFENDSQAHIYYRWKLFSILQGDTPNEWREKEFRMVIDGPIWKPPIVNFYTQGMPEELVDDSDAVEMQKGALSVAQRNRLEDLLRHLTPERSKIGDAMIFCIEHAEAADEICDCITESLSNPDTVVSKKIARLYLVSDLLHNCTVKVSNASFFRKSVEKNLVEIFETMRSYFCSLESRLKAEALKTRVLLILRAWNEWAIYPKDFISKLKTIFLGLPPTVEKKAESDIDGAPLSGDEKEDEDLDGVPLDGAALLKSVLLRGMSETGSGNKSSPHHSQDASGDKDYDDDIDGIPLDEDIDGIPLEKSDDKLSKTGGFIPSKWETIDPEQVEAQAITTSKWDTLDPVPPEPPKFYDTDETNSSDDGNFDLKRMSNEKKRAKLREIEMKTMQYQDEIESGKIELRSGWSVSQQTEHYRKKLLKKDLRKDSPVNSPLDKYGRRELLKHSPSSPDSRSKKAKRLKRSPSAHLKRRDSPLGHSSKSSKRNRSRSSSYDRSPSPSRYRLPKK